MAVTQNATHRVTVWSSNSISRYVQKIIDNIYSHKYSILEKNIYSTFTDHSQKAEAT